MSEETKQPKGITPEQRREIGGMWCEYHSKVEGEIIACEMRFRIDVPAEDHNPAELAAKLFAAAFEEQAEKMKKLQAEYYDPTAVPVTTVADLTEAKEAIENAHVEAPADAAAADESMVN